jgi:hypothetical protein
MSAELLDEGDNRIGVALDAFELQPALLVTRAIRGSRTFGNDPLQPHSTSVFKEIFAVHLQVFAVGQRRGRIPQQLLKRRLSFLQRLGA